MVGRGGVEDNVAGDGLGRDEVAVVETAENRLDTILLKFCPVRLASN